jgi:hypothetical protein
MNRRILFTALVIGLTLQESWSQNAKTIPPQHGLADTAGAVPTNTTSPNISLPLDGTRLLEAWVGRGHAGDGVWFGTQAKQAFYFFTDSGKARITIHPSGKVYFAHSLSVNGTTTTKILTVTGGADLAEPFPICENESVPVGAVVVIDEQNPGKLKLCRKAYDTRVAGVVSGAGGVNPGLILQQEGGLAEGLNVALSGRVYVLATASNGPIKPGDLLTTSSLAGHAMKVTDKVSSYCAIIGKALTSLDSGEGLVLVLVDLQ